MDGKLEGGNGGGPGDPDLREMSGPLAVILKPEVPGGIPAHALDSGSKSRCPGRGCGGAPKPVSPPESGFKPGVSAGGRCAVSPLLVVWP